MSLKKNQELFDLYTYNPRSGFFYNTTGNEIGTKDEYMKICLNNQVFYAQALAYFKMNKCFPTQILTFKDGDPLNLIWDNIEEVSRTTLSRRRKVMKNNTSGVTGVTYCKQTNKWKAMIYVDGKNRFRGRFDLFTSAVLARFYAEEEFNFFNDVPETSASKYLEDLKILRGVRYAISKSA